MKILKTLAAAAAFVPVAAFAGGFEGFYVGAYLGAAQADDRGTGYFQDSSEPSGFTHRTKPDGGLYGVALGYNHFLSDRILVGVEGDFEGRASQRDRSNQRYHGVSDPAFAMRTELTGAASLRGRLGYRVGERGLVYATAGYTTVRVKRTFIDEEMLPYERESRSTWQDGWTAGIGAHYLLSARMSVGAEFRFNDLGTKTVRSDLWSENYRQRLRDQSVRIGLNYHF